MNATTPQDILIYAAMLGVAGLFIAWRIKVTKDNARKKETEKPKGGSGGGTNPSPAPKQKK